MKIIDHLHFLLFVIAIISLPNISGHRSTRFWQKKLARNHSQTHQRKHGSRSAHHPLREFSSFIRHNELNLSPSLLAYNMALSPTIPKASPWDIALKDLNSNKFVRSGSKRSRHWILSKSKSDALPTYSDLVDFNYDTESVKLNNNDKKKTYVYKRLKHIRITVSRLLASKTAEDRSSDVRNTPTYKARLLIPPSHATMNRLLIELPSTERGTKRTGETQETGTVQKRQATLNNQHWRESCQSNSSWSAITYTRDIRNQRVVVLSTIDVVGIQVNQYFHETYCVNENSPCLGVDARSVSSKCITKNIWTYAYVRSISNGEVGWSQISIRASCNCAIRSLRPTQGRHVTST